MDYTNVLLTTSFVLPTTHFEKLLHTPVLSFSVGGALHDLPSQFLKIIQRHRWDHVKLNVLIFKNYVLFEP